MSNPIVTRFAPSPTGYLHIGGARTALFNWLYARANGGKFLLRIEDTDKARSTEDAIEAIKKGMTWLGLKPDEESVFQSAAQQRHVEVANQLLDSGLAYRSYATAEEVEAIRTKAREAKVAARYPGRDEMMDPSVVDPSLIDQSVIRFKAPIEGKTIIADKVQGDVVIANDQLDDLVLLRSDGTPTYMLAVVVDDHDMGITHVIRGDDHLTNCARQIQIYKALEWDIPTFAHIPLIHGADGAKLSKRHGALGAEQYQAMGYLPEAMHNYLARLGWAHGDEEIIPTDKLIEWFGFSGINKAPSRFDMAKLDHVNGHYMRDSDEKTLIEAIKEMVSLDGFGDAVNFDISLIDYDKLLQSLPFLKERSKTLVDLLNSSAYLFINTPLSIDEKAQKALNAEKVPDILSGLVKVLSGIETWEKEPIELILKGFCKENDLKFGKIAPPLRAVLTGTTVSPGIYDVLYSLGQRESLKRIQDYLQ